MGFDFFSKKKIGKKKKKKKNLRKLKLGEKEKERKKGPYSSPVWVVGESMRECSGCDGSPPSISHR